MAQISKELLCKYILDTIESYDSQVDFGEPEIGEPCIAIPFSTGTIMIPEGIVDCDGNIMACDDGYYVMSVMGETAAKSAFPKLISFLETLNSYIKYGDMCVDYENGVVIFRTCERFWDEHAFNAENFFEMIDEHIYAHMYYKGPIKLLIKGASSAENQIKILLEQDII